jgi:Mrp family chromosome partitioning ATPase
MPTRDVDRALERLAPRAPSPEPHAAPPAPHFAVGDAPRPQPFGAVAELDWPETVRALEGRHAARFDALADQLLAAREVRHARVLLFTSCHRAEGRTTLVLTLARRLAARPLRTLLVDADLAGPMLARSLGLRVRAGLDDVVERDVALAEAVRETPGGRLALLPLRGPVERPREFLASPGWSLALARARREYDLVLLDGGPLFAGLSAAALHRSADAAVLVVHRGLTSDRALERAAEVLEAGGIPLLGLAETFV